MGESTADIIARLDALLRTGSAPTRKRSTDSPAPVANADKGGALAGTRLGGDGKARKRNTNANRRNGGGSVYYRPDAAYFAGNPVIATERVTAPSVTPAGGTRVAGGVTVEDARATGEGNGYRTWVAARENLARDTGDVLPAGINRKGGKS